MSTEATLEEQQQASDVLVAPPSSTPTGVVLKRRKRGKSKSGSFQETVDAAQRAEGHNGRRLSTPRSAALNGHFVLENKEKKASKIVTRVTWGAVMVVGFLIITWAGHAYVFSLVLMIQVMLFKELLSVRYRAAMEKNTPLFRTLQWSWFTIGLFYTHSDSFIQFLQRQTADVPYIEEMEGVVNYISFSGFTLCFMLSVLTLRPGLYKYQIGQLAWTIVILAITVAQLKPVSTNIFSGLFWFCFPAFCIVVNDITAYVCGLCFGRRFIRRPFFSLSPNKTWEGFLGAFICTLLFAWWFAGWLAQYPYATLSAMQLRPETYTLRDVLLPGAGFAVSLNRTGELRNVDVDPVFTRLTTRTPEFLRSTLKLDYEIPARPIQLHGLILAGFGSLVAPFGGLLMSGIKRAYQIKDFDSLIPGHGGVTDRMDCQLVMIFYTFVHYQTFIRVPYRSAKAIWPLVERLSRSDQEMLLEKLTKLLHQR